MKIDGNTGQVETKATDGTRRTGAPDTGSRRAAERKPSGAGDRVELSSDGALLSSALKASTSAPEIRTELVDRMREKLAAGKVGNDAHKLADAIIDDLLK